MLARSGQREVDPGEIDEANVQMFLRPMNWTCEASILPIVVDCISPDCVEETAVWNRIPYSVTAIRMASFISGSRSSEPTNLETGVDRRR